MTQARVVIIGGGIAGCSVAYHLVKLGWRVEWHEYAMPHSVCPKEINDVSTWLSTVLAIDPLRR